MAGSGADGPSTRNSYTYPILGNVHDFDSNQLPTYNDVLRCVLWHKSERYRMSRKHPSLKEIAVKVSEKIDGIYKKASIPCVSTKRMIQLIMKYHDGYRKCLKSNGSHGRTEKYKLNVLIFLEKSNLVFDFSACDSVDFGSCFCPKDKKVPKIEQSFLKDQRTGRNLFISSVDKEVSDTLRKRACRKTKAKELHDSHKQRQTSALLDYDSDSLDSVESFESISGQSCDEYYPPSTSFKRISNETANRKKGRKKTYLHLLKLVTELKFLIELLHYCLHLS